MSSSYTTNLSLNKPANNDTAWDTSLNGNADALDALAPVGGLAVSAKETPSSTLNVKVASGRFSPPSGVEVAYAGSASQAMTASSTNYVYLTAAGVLTVNTTGFPSSVCLPLAVVVAGTTTITSVTDRRPAFRTINSGGAYEAFRAVTTTDSPTLLDCILGCDATGGAFTVTLPTPVGNAGKVYTVKRISASNNVTVATAAGSFDGASTKTLGAQYSALTVYSNGSVWSIRSTVGTVT